MSNIKKKYKNICKHLSIDIWGWPHMSINWTDVYFGPSEVHAPPSKIWKPQTIIKNLIKINFEVWTFR